MRLTETKEIVIFSAGSVILSALICFYAYRWEMPNMAILTVFTPTLFALFLTLLRKGKNGLYELFVTQTFRKISYKWFVVSILGLPFIAALAMLTSLNFEVSEVRLRTTQLLPQIVIILLIALGEEYGWRGFLLPRLLKKFSVFHSSIMVGFIWGFWHYPAYLMGTGVPLEMNFGVFLLWVVLGSLFMSWIYYYTKSVLTSILIHFSANAAFNYLLILPEFTGNMSTFWFFIYYLSVLLSIVYSIRRTELIKGYSKK